MIVIRGDDVKEVERVEGDNCFSFFISTSTHKSMTIQPSVITISTFFGILKFYI